jgi:tetratricopeptide (TPR) repeat protein
MIHCNKCKTQNPPNAQKCSKCGKDLLPGSGLGERAAGFGCMIILAALSIPVMYLCSSAAASAGEGTGTSLALMILGPIGAIIFLLMALVVAFRKVDAWERYENRAKRHIKLDPGQAISDFTQSLATLPERSKTKRLELLKQRAEVWLQQNKPIESQADYQQALTLADELYENEPQKGKIKYMEERANLLEKLGRQEEADLEGLNYTYLTEKALPEKKVAMGVMEGIEKANLDSKRKEVYSKRKTILERGRFKALGYCRKCKTAVELDYTLGCTVNIKHEKIDSIRFVKTEEVERAKQEITTRH